MARKAARKKGSENYGWKSVYEEPPRKHVLLLSCMDQRLLDDTVRFMNRLNLHNRYDQLTLAGAAMGARIMPGPKSLWRSVFFTHLSAAIDVLHRDIQDIFLVEHLDCGAYKYLHPDLSVRKRYYHDSADLSILYPYHYEEASLFAKEIEAYCQEQQDDAKSDPASRVKDWKNIRVRLFLMDLLGNVMEFDDDGVLHDPPT